MIVDAHTHLGDFPTFNVKLDAKGLVDIMKECGVEHSVLFSHPNKLTHEAILSYPGRFTGLVWVNPKHGEKALREIEMGVKKWGFKGVKMHPLMDSFLPDDPVVHPVIELAIKLGAPTLFHCGHPPWSLPWHIGNLADIYPDARIILGHMGHGHIVYINGSLDIARKHDNVYLETSGMPMHSKVKEAIETVGIDRVMFGSDAPFGHPSFEIRKVEVSGLSSDHVEKVLGENAEKLFNIDTTH